MTRHSFVARSAFILWLLMGLFVQGVMLYHLWIAHSLQYIMADCLLGVGAWLAAFLGAVCLLRPGAEVAPIKPRFIGYRDVVYLPLLGYVMWKSPAVPAFMLLGAVFFVPTFGTWFYLYGRRQGPLQKTLATR